MKCSECGHEWNALTSDAVKSENCPLCGKKMKINYHSFSSLAEGISYVMAIYAEKNQKPPYEILRNTNTFSNYLKDLLGTSYPESNILQLVVRSDVMKILYDVCEADDHAKYLATENAVQYLQREYAMELPKAIEIINLFITALGWNLSNKKEFSQNVSLPSKKEAQNAVLPQNIEIENIVLPESATTENIVLPETLNFHSHKVQKTTSISRENRFLIPVLLFLILAVIVIALMLWHQTKSTENLSLQSETIPESSEMLETESVIEETEIPVVDPVTEAPPVEQVTKALPIEPITEAPIIEKPDYSGILRRTAQDIPMAFFYAYQDLNGDGVEELIISWGEMGDHDNNYIYTYQNGSPVYLENVSAAQGTLYLIPAKHIVMGCNIADGEGVAYDYQIYEMTEDALVFLESYSYYDGSAWGNSSYYLHNGEPMDADSLLHSLDDYLVQSIIPDFTEYRR